MYDPFEVSEIRSPALQFKMQIHFVTNSYPDFSVVEKCSSLEADDVLCFGLYSTSTRCALLFLLMIANYHTIYHECEISDR